MRRSKSLQIYLKPGIREDDILLEVWDACVQFDRSQDVFRSILRHGLLSMVESGLMPEAVVDACDLERLVERRKRKAGRRLPEQHPPSQTYPAPYPSQDRVYYAQDDVYRAPAPYPPRYASPDEDRLDARNHYRAVNTEPRKYADSQRLENHLELPSRPPVDRQSNGDTLRTTDERLSPSRETEPLNNVDSDAKQKRDEKPLTDTVGETTSAPRANNGKPKKLGNLM